MAYNLWNDKILESIRKDIESGNNEVYNDFIAHAKKASKAANSRLSRLEKAEFTYSNAYERATYYTSYEFGTNRFKINKSMSIDDIIEQYREIRTFMRKESSTVTGVKSANNRLLDFLETHDVTVPKEDRKKFFEFVNSDEVQDFIEVVGDSDIILDIIANNIDTISEEANKVKMLFNKFFNGEIFYDDLLERMTGKSYESLYEHGLAIRNRNASRKDHFRKL